MTEKATPSQDVLERYLLGEASDDERAEVEQGYFADDELFDQLVELQNDLVDSYAQGTLTPTERKRFESRFLTSSSGMEQVEFARALQRKAEARLGRRPVMRPRRAGLRRLAIAASVAIVFLAAAWMMFSLQRRHEPPITESRPQSPLQQRPTLSTPVQAQTQTAPLQREQTPAALITVL
ncbi:MAG TPA: hypothetical protein VII12_09655, partial [Thermoanaerobaculia bacterium]